MGRTEDERVAERATTANSFHRFSTAGIRKCVSEPEVVVQVRARAAGASAG